MNLRSSIVEIVRCRCDRRGHRRIRRRHSRVAAWEKVAVVEKQSALGGTCLIWGCIPTKALLEHAHALKVIQHAYEWGVTIPSGTPAIDMTQVHARKDKIVDRADQGHRVPVQEKQDRLDQGHGAAGGPGKVEVFEGDTQTLEAKEIIIATGSSPRSVPRHEIDHKRIITSDEAIHLKEVPKSLVIMGSGAVGVEFASIYRRFGSEVTIIELLPRLVPVEDEAVSAELEKSFKKQGIKSLTGTKVTKATATASGVTIEAQTPDGKTQTISAETAAGGHRSRARHDGARRRGSRHRRWRRATSRWTSCIARLCRTYPRSATSSRSAPAFTRSSRTCRRWRASSSRSALPGKAVQPINYDHVPGCTYCDPEIGSVGLTEAEAKERGYDVRVGTFPFGVLGRAKMAGETEGFVKIVADKKYDEVLGVHMIGPRSTELVAEAVLALRLECTVEELIKTIHAHPTFSEAVAKRRTRRTARRYICRVGQARYEPARTSPRPIAQSLCPHPS